MDFRTTPLGSNRPPLAGAMPTAHERKEERRDEKPVKQPKAMDPKWMRILTMVLLAGIVLLLVGITLAINRSGHNGEAQYIDHSKYQAVFLNNGQVYFGNIESLSGSYVRMTNIYYLTQNSTKNSSNDYSLVKLGCQQIHDPIDQMVINRSEISFWENLNSSGKVVSSIKQFQQQNPNGPNCSQVSTQTQASSNTATQGSTSTNSTTSTKK